jgi:hypothetical protein
VASLSQAFASNEELGSALAYAVRIFARISTGFFNASSAGLNFCYQVQDRLLCKLMFFPF